ncbi:MAG TPA: hypothetical protein VMS17_13965 [Gemmataceae bacterium]|nr:hypothetical protein [Gemmataceae bacterium]
MYFGRDAGPTQLSLLNGRIRGRARLKMRGVRNSARNHQRYIVA